MRRDLRRRRRRYRCFRIAAAEQAVEKVFDHAFVAIAAGIAPVRVAIAVDPRIVLIAGFAFGNIMMMSFPEYFSIDGWIESQFQNLFRYFNLFLSLPVVTYCAFDFYSSAWKGLKNKQLNI